MDRFRASKQSAEYLHRLHGQLVPSTFDCYGAAIRELPRLSWVGTPISTQLHELLQATTVGSNAAAAALCTNQPKVSVEWLEQARSVVWSQILQMRTPLNSRNSQSIC